MRIRKLIGSLLLALVITALFIIPIVALYMISSQEHSQYVTPVIDITKERGYGEPKAVFRTDFAEAITVSGQIISNDHLFMELSAYKDPYRIRWIVSPGDAVHCEDLIGYYNGKEITSSVTGIIREISLSSKPYIRFDSLESLALECYVSDAQLSILQREDLNLSDQDGNTLHIINIDLIRSSSGTKVIFAYDHPDLVYGTYFDNMIIATGNIYKDTLVVEESCVYQKSGDDHHYVRILDENGFYLSEAVVKTGYADGKLICISGVPEGTLCDSGYKALIEG